MRHLRALGKPADIHLIFCRTGRSAERFTPWNWSNWPAAIPGFVLTLHQFYQQGPVSEEFLRSSLPRLCQAARLYLRPPLPLNKLVQSHLRNAGVPIDRIHTEEFETAMKETGFRRIRCFLGPAIGTMVALSRHDRWRPSTGEHLSARIHAGANCRTRHARRLLDGHRRARFKRFFSTTFRSTPLRRSFLKNGAARRPPKACEPRANGRDHSDRCLGHGRGLSDRQRWQTDDEAMPDAGCAACWLRPVLPPR